MTYIYIYIHFFLISDRCLVMLKRKYVPCLLCSIFVSSLHVIVEYLYINHKKKRLKSDFFFWIKKTEFVDFVFKMH